MVVMDVNMVRVRMDVNDGGSDEDIEVDGDEHKCDGQPTHLTLGGFGLSSILLEISEGVFDQLIQIHLLLKLQLWISLQHQ